jgi:hypothetical protein
MSALRALSLTLLVWLLAMPVLERHCRRPARASWCCATAR